jgi:hypothetical protein
MMINTETHIMVLSMFLSVGGMGFEDVPVSVVYYIRPEFGDGVETPVEPEHAEIQFVFLTISNPIQGGMMLNIIQGLTSTELTDMAAQAYEDYLTKKRGHHDG